MGREEKRPKNLEGGKIVILSTFTSTQIPNYKTSPPPKKKKTKQNKTKQNKNKKQKKETNYLMGGGGGVGKITKCLLSRVFITPFSLAPGRFVFVLPIFRKDVTI